MTAIFTDRLGLDWDGDDPDDAEVAGALDLTLANVTSYLVVALHYDDFEPDAIDALDDRCFDELEDLLSKEQLAKAVVALLIPHASPAAVRLVQQFRELAAADQPRRDTT
jgi:hypothetical protein